MSQYAMLNYVLANNKKKELEAQGITVPPDFMTKGLLYGMIAPNIPMLGYIIIDKEAKKLISEKAAIDALKGEKAEGETVKGSSEETEAESGTKSEETTAATETGNPPTLPPLVNITAVDRSGNKMKRVYFASIPGKVDENFANILSEKSYDSAVTDENGVAHLFCPKDSDVTIISFFNDRLSKLEFEAGKLPNSLEFLVEPIPETIETDSSALKRQKAASSSTARKSDNPK